MNVRARMPLISLVCLLSAPGLALAGVCYDVTGLPEAAALNVVALAAPPGPVPLVGEAQGVCGLGQPAAAVQGTAIVDASGATRVGLRLQADRPGCSGGEAEIVLAPPFVTGSGQIRLPEGSVANVGLTLDRTGQVCQPRSARPAACVATATTLCVLQNRFRITATLTPGTQNLPGQAGKNGSESGFFSFFGSSNVELIVKVLDGRGLNTFYWVLVTPSTDVGYTVTVIDTQNARVKTYTSPVGASSGLVFDTTAFSASP